MIVFGFKIPVYITPIGTTPTPPTLQTSYNDNLKGLSIRLTEEVTESNASIRVGPLYQPKFDDFSIKLSPKNPDIGIKGTFSGL
jgi:hypothetical protein